MVAVLTQMKTNSRRSLARMLMALFSIRVPPRSCVSKTLLSISALVLASLACQSLSAPLATATPNQPPTPAHVPPVEGRTRADPFPAGSVAEAPNWRIELVEFVRGGRAWEILRSANQFNDPAPEGFEYVLIYAQVTSSHDDNQSHDFGTGDLKLTGDRLIRYFRASAVTPDPTLEGAVRNGESAEGWTVFLVAEGEGNLIVIVDVLEEYEPENLRYLALDEGARVAVDGALRSIEPNAVGEDLSEPALLNRAAIAPDWEITVLASVRGVEAYEMALETNHFNDPPGEGMEYIAVKVHARSIATEDDAVWLDSGAFGTLGSDGTEYSAPPVVDPEPALDAVLYPGGEATGWIVVQAKVGDPTLLVFQPFTDFEKINRRYFALKP